MLRPSRLRRAVVLAVLGLALSSMAGQAAPGGQTAPDPVFVAGGNTDLANYKIVFTVQDNDANSYQDIYTARGDGSEVRRLRPLGDNIYYDWPVWAFNGTRIIFSARGEPKAGGEENLYMMATDGSQVTPLTFTSWRNVQPKLSPDGRSLLFNSGWREFPEVGIYRLDLASGQVQALSARRPDAANDADPRWSADGRSIVFASLGELENGERPTQVFRMDADGGNRQRITTERFFDTDPALSPDGRYVAISSYRGDGHPVAKQARDNRNESAPLDDKDVALTNWRLIVRDLTANTEWPLTAGKDCLLRLPPNVCTPDEGPAWVPIWVDGNRIAYISGRSGLGMGLFVVGKDGSNPRPTIEVLHRKVSWHDWTQVDQPPPSAALVQSLHLGPPPASLLYIGPVHGEIPPGETVPPPSLFKATADRWLSADLRPHTEAGEPLVPQVARWTADKKNIILSARLPQPSIEAFDSDQEPDPDLGMPGQTQIFLMSADSGPARQLTTPWTEDALDPFPDNTPRSNSDPDMTPDGRYVIYVNHSDTQAWIMRMDMRTGEVVNLTSINRGIIPGADAHPRVSPDGRQIAFVATLGFNVQVFTMSLDGQEAHQVTNSLLQAADPSWSPDARSLVFATLLARDSEPELTVDPFTGGVRRIVSGNWSLSRVDLDSGAMRTLVAGERPMLWPSWSPDGMDIAYIGFGPGLQPDIYHMTSDGRDPHPLAITVRSRETFVDWR